MNRRALLLGLTLPFLATGHALAQEQPAPRAPRRRRPDPQDGAYMGGGMVVPSTPSVGQGNQSFAASRVEPAPVPNTRLEPPRGIPQVEGPRLTPGVIAPRIPGRGSAQETGSPGSLQDRLFRPSPGAHLRIPLSW